MPAIRFGTPAASCLERPEGDFKVEEVAAADSHLEKEQEACRRPAGNDQTARRERPRRRPSFSISLEKVCFVIAKAGELDVKVAPEELDDASDENMMQRILEDYADDPTFEELRSFFLD